MRLVSSIRAGLAAALLALCFPLVLPAQNAGVDSPTLTALSRYFAGLEQPAGSPFTRQTQVGGYPWFKSEMNRYWNNFRTTTFQHIRSWQKTEATDLSRQTVLYPFSGPDFLNVYAVYPEADTYIMIGLEKGGLVPDLEGMSVANIQKGLNMMVEGFRIYIGFNFYRTLGMEVDLNLSPFTGTLPHVLTQIAWLGYTPLSVSSVSFTAQGQIVTKPLAIGQVTTSWQLECRSSAGKTMKIIFLSQDVSNSGLAAVPGLKRYLESLPRVSGLFKAASYLPPREFFTEMTKICLSKMNSIVQDDSAIPYRMLANDYDVTVYGFYDRPHGLFPSYGQPDLAQLYRQRPRKALAFNFQYDRPDGSRNLMVARRKAGR
ncbi:MAG TPA: hypothetical protein PLD82_08150 [Spirochaetota bacterium]|nr:hypothetical protein [Spirochaetota bacterium]